VPLVEKTRDGFSNGLLPVMRSAILFPLPILLTTTAVFLALPASRQHTYPRNT
jgi:hypothetical protein